MKSLRSWTRCMKCADDMIECIQDDLMEMILYIGKLKTHEYQSASCPSNVTQEYIDHMNQWNDIRNKIAMFLKLFSHR